MEKRKRNVVRMREIGKVKSQRKNLENEELTLQERFNTLQQNIAKANEKMDTYKLDMKNILEELVFPKINNNIKLNKENTGDGKKKKKCC